VRFNLRTSVLLLALAPTTLTAILLGLLPTLTRLQDLELAHRQRGQAIVNQLAPAAEFAVFTKNTLLLRQLAFAALQEADVVDVVIRDASGETLIQGYREPDGTLLIDPLLPQKPRNGWVFESPIVRTELDIIENTFMFSESPARASGVGMPIIGHVVVAFNRDPASQRQQQVVVNMLATLGLCLFGAAIAGWRLERTLTTPIVTLEGVVQKLRNGELNTRVEERSTAELGALESGVNAMATALQASRDTLQQQVAEATQELQETLMALEHQNLDLQEARFQAEQANRSKSEFLATMSHELRTPLNGVLGFITLLGKTPLSQSQAQQLDFLKQSADNLLQVINSILDFSKIEAGKLDLKRAPFDVKSILTYAVQLFAAKAEELQLTLNLQLDPELPKTLIGDAQRLTQIVTNLVSNAVKFTDRGGVNVVATVLPSTTDRIILQLMVSDTGIGIAPTAQAVIFDAFSQADSSRTRHFSGTGLGLAICQQLVTLMGGEIKLISKPGRGSTFTVQLPFSRPAQTDVLGHNPAPTFKAMDDENNQPVVAISATAHADGAPRYPVSVLVVDDHAMNRTFARLILEDWVQDIEEAVDGQQALQACQNQHYGLILLDLRMPGLDGLAVARCLREQDGPNQQTPIIAVTADVLREGASEWQAAGINDCLHKPLVTEQLESVIRHWCLKSQRNMTKP